MVFVVSFEHFMTFRRTVTGAAECPLLCWQYLPVCPWQRLYAPCRAGATLQDAQASRATVKRGARHGYDRIFVGR